MFDWFRFCLHNRSKLSVGSTLKKSDIYCWISLILFLFSFESFAKKPPSQFYDLPKVVAVQNRPYYNNTDLTLQLGWLPSDAFNKGYSAGFTFSSYFLDYLAWEVINANYIINQETSLKGEFEKLNVDVSSKGFGGALDYMVYYATTGLVYTPFYNKSLLFNDKVVHGSTSLVVSGGVAGFKETGSRFLVSGGLILKFYTEDNNAWKVDLRNNIYFEETLGAVYALTIGVGYSFELGDAPKNLGQ